MCRSRGLEHVSQRIQETGCEYPQLVAMPQGQPAQGHSPLVRQRHEDAATVEGIGSPLNQASASHTVDQAHGSVVANLQPVGQVRHTGVAVLCQPAQHQQQLILPRAQVSYFGGSFAERLDAPQHAPCLRQAGVLVI
jgi:hypothetical protein